MNRILVLFFTLAVIFVPSYAQEELELPLTHNNILIGRSLTKEPMLKNGSGALPTSQSDTIALPFIDDFVGDGVYPDTSLWLDNYVYINRGFGIAPPTFGVATFDGLNQNGYPYNFSAPLSSSAVADYLTSKYLDLGSGLVPADSVYLSFFYQAKGLGNEPETLDSLIVQFEDSLYGWRNVWGVRGYSPGGADTGFRHVMIPVKDAAYFYKGFRFRFVNHATLSGAFDHWHIDYVYLDKNRNVNDTIYNDVSFVYTPTSFLRNYSAMPWNQYQPSELTDTIRLRIRNNYTAAANTTYIDSLRDVAGLSVWGYDGGSCNVPAFFATGAYSGCSGHSSPAPTFSFPPFTDTASFFAEHVLSYNLDERKRNDTLVQVQKFKTYYAFDDGSAESGYGLTANNASFSYRITLNQPDTLRAFDIYFNPIQNSVSSYPMRFAVWSDIVGYPSTLLRKDSIVYPVYGSEVNGFTRYLFDTLNPYVMSPGTYHFGWIQHTNNILNVGLDKNNSSIGKMYYNVGTGWFASSIKGSVMIRPVFGEKLNATGIEDGSLPYKERRKAITVFPNPSSGEVYLKEANSIESLVIYNVLGEEVMLINNPPNRFNINSLDPGIYFLYASSKSEKFFPYKLILTH